jgi:hypothetical protein
MLLVLPFWIPPPIYFIWSLCKWLCWFNSLWRNAWIFFHNPWFASHHCHYNWILRYLELFVDSFRSTFLHMSFVCWWSFWHGLWTCSRFVWPWGFNEWLHSTPPIVFPCGCWLQPWVCGLNSWGLLTFGFG